MPDDAPFQGKPSMKRRPGWASPAPIPTWMSYTINCAAYWQERRPLRNLDVNGTEPDMAFIPHGPRSGHRFPRKPGITELRH